MATYLAKDFTYRLSGENITIRQSTPVMIAGAGVTKKVRFLCLLSFIIF